SIDSTELHMNRLSIVLALVAGLLAGALGYSLLDRGQPQTDAVAVRAIVDEVLTERASSAPVAVETSAEIDPEQIESLIEDFLMRDPKLLQRMSVALEDTLRTEEQSRVQTMLADYQDQIFNAKGDVILGNPDGDVTLVEFFDYNCGYCRNALPDLAALL